MEGRSNLRLLRATAQMDSSSGIPVSSRLRTLTGTLRLIRVENCIGIAACTAVGGVLAATHESGYRLAGAGVVVSLVLAFGNAVNDLFDIDLDRTSKPERVLPSGRVKVRAARMIAGSAATLAVVLSLVWLSLPLALLVTSMVILSFVYSWKLKAMPVLGNYVVAAQCGYAVVFGALAVGQPTIRTWAASALVFSGVGAVEIAKALEDCEADSLHGARTLGVSLNESQRRCVLAGACCLYLSCAVFPLVVAIVTSPAYILVFAPVLPLIGPLADTRSPVLDQLGPAVRTTKVLWSLGMIGMLGLYS